MRQVDYCYEYRIFDGLRQQVVRMFKELAKRHVPSTPSFGLTAVGTVLEFDRRSSGLTISGQVQLSQIHNDDLKKVIKEAFFELSQDEVTAIAKNWHFLDFKPYAVQRCSFQDWAADWEKAPQRLQEAEALRASKSAVRKQRISGRWLQVKKSTWLATLLVALGLASYLVARMLPALPPIVASSLNVLGTVATVTGLMLQLTPTR